MWVFGVVALVGSLSASVAFLHDFKWANISQAFAFLAIGTAGLAIALRQPRNAVGWIYLAVWIGVALGFAFDQEYADWATLRHPGAPFGTFATWLSNWIWVPIFGMLLTLPFLLFPDGHLPSRRWRKVAIGAPIVIGLWAVTFAMQDSQYTNAANQRVPNPYAIHALTPFFNVANAILSVLVLATFGVCVASLVVRFRRSHADERQQIKWLMYSAALVFLWILLPLNHGSGGVADFAQGFFLALIPASVGVAILKYRLYDIDVVIKKTVVFTVVTAVLSLSYLAVIALATLGTVSKVAVGIILLAVTFNPVRRAARSLADRLVYGRRATSYEVLSQFSERMADTYATDDVLPRMATILAGATGATSATVWLKVGAELRPAARAGDNADGAPAPIRVVGDTLPRLTDDVAEEVRQQGELLGALSVSSAANDPLDPGRLKLVHDLASQAGLVLRNVRLIEELKASRQRLVAAQDERAKKLERDIHDGAQQQLVALTVKLRLLEQIAERDGAKARLLASELQTEANSALADLRDLARGIYPPLLADKGLVAALEAQARRSSVPVTVEGDDIGRFGQEVESAVYFSCLEALQNVAKYAKANTASVHLSNGSGVLRFAVSDDGRGFDTSSTSYGTGLQGIADRLAAIGGSLEVISSPQNGTTVNGSVPV
jgi:signal transduction histidine kinase